MNNHFSHTNLIQRPAHTVLDHATIHVGDIVHLQPVDGPTIRATVIFNAPIDGITTYTTEIVSSIGVKTKRCGGQRIRFRYEHVHRIEPLRARSR